MRQPRSLGLELAAGSFGDLGEKLVERKVDMSADLGGSKRAVEQFKSRLQMVKGAGQQVQPVAI
jgi:hypothetical protein